MFEASLRQAVARGPLDDALAGLGWYDAITADPAIAEPVFGVQGELNVSSSAIDDVVIAALGLTPSASTAVVMPAFGLHTPNTESVHGIGTRRLTAASEAILAVRRDRDVLVGRVPVSALTQQPIVGIDPSGGWVEVTAELADGEAMPWNRAVAAAQRAIATELTAASRTMLRLAREHAIERIQFGRPIASFQAVRHKVAECLLAVEAAQAAVDVAWTEPSEFASAMAKAIAGRSSKTVAKHAQQVLAGMGFTAEHPFHRYLKRTLLLDQLFGSGASVSEELGAVVLRNRNLPAILPL